MFNIRVYGLFIYNRQILISNEIYKGHSIVKFPGGGLKPGEGILDCFLREIKEETGQTPVSFSQYYISEQYQASAFDPKQEVICIYYKASLPNPCNIEVTNLKEEGSYIQDIKWMSLDSFNAEILTFPIDKKVFDMLHRNSR